MTITKTGLASMRLAALLLARESLGAQCLSLIPTVLEDLPPAVREAFDEAVEAENNLMVLLTSITSEQTAGKPDGPEE